MRPSLSRGLAPVALALSLAALAACSPPESAALAPDVGDAAPAFSARPVTRDGAAQSPLSLQELRGKTVVLAFFPKARTPGCTVQMKAYRDRYATVFNGGDNVVLLGVSTDTEAALAEWARDENFPFAFVSDADGALGARYGALDPGDRFADRVLYVIAPDGTVAYKVSPFRQNSEEAYTELEAAIDRAVAQ